jgi:hypothetical protein
MGADGVLRRLRELRDETGDTHILALMRIGFGLLLANEARLATEVLSREGFFGDHFHQPLLPASLVASFGLYRCLLVAQWLCAVLVLMGRLARPALLVASSLVLYTMLCDRLEFHHYRHTMIAFATLLAFTPCDRHMVLGRPGDESWAPIWAANAMRAQVSFMYLASGGSKALDPEWRGGLQMREMIRLMQPLLHGRGIPSAWIDALELPLTASLLAKSAIATELSVALLLFWPPVRRGAIWAGILLHVTISLITPVMLFTAQMLVIYLVFATPDRKARVLRYDPARLPITVVMWSLDWLGRYRLEPEPGARFTVVDRRGRELHGIQGVACLFGTIPALFLAWPALAAVAWARAGGALTDSGSDSDSPSPPEQAPTRR